MTGLELVSSDLTDGERDFIVLAHNEYRGPAKRAYRLLGRVLGCSDKAEWFSLIDRLIGTVKGSHHPMNELDWARALFLTEVSFRSDLVENARGSNAESGTDQ